MDSVLPVAHRDSALRALLSALPLLLVAAADDELPVAASTVAFEQASLVGSHLPLLHVDESLGPGSRLAACQAASAAYTQLSRIAAEHGFFGALLIQQVWLPLRIPVRHLLATASELPRLLHCSAGGGACCRQLCACCLPGGGIADAADSVA